MVEQLVERFHVIGHAGNDPSHGRNVKEPKGQLVDMLEQLLPNFIDDVLPQLLEHPHLHGVAHRSDHQNHKIRRRIPRDHRERTACGDGVHGVAHQHRTNQIGNGHHQCQQQCQRYGLFSGAQVAEQTPHHAGFSLLHGAPPFPPEAEAPAAAAHKAVHSCRPASKAPNGFPPRRSARPRS